MQLENVHLNLNCDIIRPTVQKNTNAYTGSWAGIVDKDCHEIERDLEESKWGWPTVTERRDHCSSGRGTTRGGEKGTHVRPEHWLSAGSRNPICISICTGLKKYTFFLADRIISLLSQSHYIQIDIEQESRPARSAARQPFWGAHAPCEPGHGSPCFGPFRWPLFHVIYYSGGA